MASCTQIKAAVQAFVDSELSPAERVIVEEHLGSCSACHGYLRDQQKVSATLFEYYRDARLSHSLRTAVLCHLPDMDNSSVELEAVNWRVKHPRPWWAAYSRWAPVAAAALLVIVGAIIHQNWPEQQAVADAVGVVAQIVGPATVQDEAIGRTYAARLSAYIAPGHVFETGETGGLMLAMRHGTTAKMAENSRLRVAGARNVTLEKGQAWLDVGKNPQLFQVRTPEGKVTVFGTAFDVRLEDALTIVTVQRGEVQVENADGFRRVRNGQRIRFASSGVIPAPEEVDASRSCAWINGIQADQDAYAHFMDQFGNDVLASSSIPALPIFWIDIRGKALPNGGFVEIEWERMRNLNRDFCDYTVYIADDAGNALLTHRITGATFASALNLPYSIAIGPEALRDTKAIKVWLVPDYTTGVAEPRDIRVPSLTPAAVN